MQKSQFLRNLPRTQDVETDASSLEAGIPFVWAAAPPTGYAEHSRVSLLQEVPRRELLVGKSKQISHSQ